MLMCEKDLQVIGGLFSMKQNKSTDNNAIPEQTKKWKNILFKVESLLQ